MPTETTRGVRVTVESRFSPERSKPGIWFFLYTITIVNEGEQTVQLLRRHWHIQDAHGELQEVEGEGVVGEQPVLEPGRAFRYTSGCPLGTSFGSMHGTYLMRTADGETFQAAIPGFSLRLAGAAN